MSGHAPWQAFLVRHGARFHPPDASGWAAVADFGNPAAEYDAAVRQAALFDVSGRGKLQVTGPDAARFLHNLCTNDVLRLRPGEGCEAFLTTHKARVVAHVQLYAAAPSEFWLDTDFGLGNVVYKHLDHYLISEKVELTDRTWELAQAHLCGPRAATLLETLCGPGAIAFAVRSLPGVPEVQVRTAQPFGSPGYDFVCPVERMATVWETLVQAGACPAGLEVGELLRVEAGLPAQAREIDEDRFVVELDRITQAISYTKGCYLGQEPIVMARDRGHVNRKLRGLCIHGPQACPPGTPIYHAEQEAGRVTSSVVSPRYGPIALAYLRRGHEAVGTALEIVVGGQRVPVTVSALPFSGG